MNILITGISSGLGLGIAKYYLDNKATVYGISRKSNMELESYPNFHYLSHDLTRFEQNMPLLKKFLTGVKKIDIVILNAGILDQLNDIRDTPIKAFKKVMDINVWANKALVDTLSTLIPQIDQIVGISSGASQNGARGWNAYSISKTSLNMLLNLYAKELPDTHFCALAPGLINTGMQEYLFSVKETNKFPTVKRLQKAKKDGTMPDIHQAAKIVATAISKVKKLESGSYADVRNMQ